MWLSFWVRLLMCTWRVGNCRRYLRVVTYCSIQIMSTGTAHCGIFSSGIFIAMAPTLSCVSASALTVFSLCVICKRQRVVTPLTYQQLFHFRRLLLITRRLRATRCWNFWKSIIFRKAVVLRIMLTAIDSSCCHLMRLWCKNTQCYFVIKANNVVCWCSSRCAWPYTYRRWPRQWASSKSTVSCLHASSVACSCNSE